MLGARGKRRPHSPREEVTAHDVARYGVVVDDEDAHPAQIGPLVDRSRRPREARGKPERRADAGLALDADLAVHQLGEAPRDRKAEPGAAEAARRRALT